MSDRCGQCGQPTGNRKERYCRPCRKAVLLQMKLGGYLQETYVPPYWSDERGRKGLRDTRVLGGTPH